MDLEPGTVHESEFEDIVVGTLGVTSMTRCLNRGSVCSGISASLSAEQHVATGFALPSSGTILAFEREGEDSASLLSVESSPRL